MDAAADNSEDDDGEDGMEEDEPSPKVAKGPEPRKRPPGTPSKGGGGGGGPTELGEGTPLVSASQFQAAEGRVEGLERKLAQEVDSLRGEITSVKRDVTEVRAMTEQGFSSVLARLDAMRASPALPAPDPAALPLPSDGPHLLAGGDGPTGDSRPPIHHPRPPPNPPPTPNRAGVAMGVIFPSTRPTPTDLAIIPTVKMGIQRGAMVITTVLTCR